MSENSILTDHQYIVFELEKQIFGIDILKVQTIEVMLPITKIPSSFEYFEGIINLRGEVIPIISLKKKLDLKESESKQAKIITMYIRDAKIGIIVDEAKDVVRIANEDVDTSM
ncbi:chemotaxis protein CheW [Natranaerofaba carboxydovora]|uniref:chemotaxis protein CheW n=1 Tax=Natranaerofaba carboxydovora TaxID=2742683 RepID=UPI001F12CB31|nr:chemotaxis protein CheW [Natranaerofaba carboxydovora]UMZ74223.1 Chemotaxis protein CheW [Natranaerofaba carboxydovora]